MLKKEIIALNVVTPLFTGRIDETTNDIQRHKAELSATSFRGIIHWWFRTLYGSQENLPQKEAELVGSIKNGSSVKLRILPFDGAPQDWEEPKGHKIYGHYTFSSSKEGNYDGLKYFTYAQYIKSKKYHTVTVRQFYPPGTRFSLAAIGQDESLTIHKSVLWFALQFSGIGNRSRRCFGNLEIRNPEQITHVDKIFYFQNVYTDQDEYKTILRNNLKSVRDRILPGTFQGENRITTFDLYTRLFLSEEGFETWEEAVNFAGVTLQKFRALQPPEHDILQNPKDHKTFELIRPILGLPIQFRFSSESSSDKAVLINQSNDKGELTRFASPVVASLTKIGNKYFVQLLLLSRDFYALNIKAKYKEEKYGIKQVTVDTKAKDKFVSHLVNGFSFKEAPDDYYRYNEIKLWS